MAPPNAHVIACFRTPAEAAAHGFPLPVPRGTVIVRGVFLLPAAPVMGSRCRGIAHRLGFPVPCPGLLPLPVTTPLQPPQCLTVGDCAQTGTNGTVGVPAFVYDDGFAAPPGYHGVSGMPDGHVVIIAARASAVSAVSYARLSFCLGLPAVRKPAISGIRAVVVGCPEGSYETGGHELLRWEHDGVMAAVSFHGHNATNIDLAITVARHMVWTGGR